MYSIPGKDIVLASASPARREMMDSAMVRHTAEAAPVDEEELRLAGEGEGVSALDMATALAEAKAARVSMARPGALVIGADQLLECEGRWLGKPADRDAAAANLRFLAGKTHRLATACVVCEGGGRIWHHAESPSVAVRGLTDGEIGDYLDDLGDGALGTPGVYRMEDRGPRILARVEGCPYAVLGMPLLPLLALLREHGLQREARAP